MGQRRNKQGPLANCVQSTPVSRRYMCPLQVVTVGGVSKDAIDYVLEPFLPPLLTVLELSCYPGEQGDRVRWVYAQLRKSIGGFSHDLSSAAAVVQVLIVFKRLVPGNEAAHL